MKVGIVNCGGANLNSIYYSLSRIGVKSIISVSQKDLDATDYLILPGVGSATVVMEHLRDNNLIDYIKYTTKPILGICVGMQILFEHSEEGDTDCLGLLDGMVKKFTPIMDEPVPQMGWNSVKWVSNYSHLDDYFYFANSYYVKTDDYEVGNSAYITDFSSVIKKNNITGCQFHPEKSSSAGEKFLKEFLKL